VEAEPQAALVDVGGRGGDATREALRGDSRRPSALAVSAIQQSSTTYS
jgi:hypothetical protein